MKRNLIILRGVSGAGKSTFCNLIGGNKVVCCADDFFTDADGNYNFVPTLLGQAHKKCQEKFEQALAEIRVDNIIIANTNTKPSDWRYYEERALEKGLTVTHVILENRHGNKDVHMVPPHVRQQQESLILQNIKLK